MNIDYFHHTSELFKELNLLKLNDIFQMQVLLYIHKTINYHHDDSLLSNLTKYSSRHSYATRNCSTYVTPRIFKSTSRHCMEYLGVQIWNALPENLRHMTNLREFKTNIILMLQDEY